ncbi:MAG: ribokinase [Clostridia bacterium]|nr:ribokinase [Clostridia bacterium]
MKVLNFGSLNLDYVYQVDHFVRAGETLSARAQSVKAGGKGLNQSIALALSGAQVWHAGCIGQGGDSLCALLTHHGIHTDFLCRKDTMQGNAIIQVNAAGENCILLFGGSNQCITEEQIKETLSAFSKGDYLILQNEVNLVASMVDEAWKRGMRIVLNPSPYNEQLSGVDYSKLSWVLVNEIEAEQLTGHKDPEKAWGVIHERYPKLSLLITLGSAGSTAWSVHHGKVEHASHEAFAVQAVDTTAAGDTFTGYFISALMESRPLKECMRRAAKAAAIAVTRPGAAESIPSLNELNDECIKEEKEL